MQTQTLGVNQSLQLKKPEIERTGALTGAVWFVADGFIEEAIHEPRNNASYDWCPCPVFESIVAHIMDSALNLHK